MFFWAKKIFVGKKIMFLGENAFFTISESKIRKKSKIVLKGFSIGYKVAYKISGQYIHK